MHDFKSFATFVVWIAFAFANNVSALQLNSGDVVTIQLATPLCGSQEFYLGYNNKTCTAGPKLKDTAGPVLRSSTDGSANWKQWKVEVETRNADGSYLVALSNYYPSSKGKINCNGVLVTEKPDLCTTGKYVDRMHIHENGKTLWRLVPTKAKDTFSIVAEDRRSGCLRFVGASGDCPSPYPMLFASDNQQWMINVVEKASSPPPPPPSREPSTPPPPPPAARTAPGAPTNVAASNVQWSSLTLSWTDGSAGNPEETYLLKCVHPWEGCSGSAVAPEVTGIKRGTQQGTVTDLQPGISYRCFVIASNDVGQACSAGIQVTTNQPRTSAKYLYVVCTASQTIVICSLTTDGIDPPSCFSTYFLNAPLVGITVATPAQNYAYAFAPNTPGAVTCTVTDGGLNLNCGAVDSSAFQPNSVSPNYGVCDATDCIVSSSNGVYTCPVVNGQFSSSAVCSPFVTTFPGAMYGVARYDTNTVLVGGNNGAVWYCDVIGTVCYQSTITGATLASNGVTVDIYKDTAFLADQTKVYVCAISNNNGVISLACGNGYDNNMDTPLAVAYDHEARMIYITNGNHAQTLDYAVTYCRVNIASKSLSGCTMYESGNFWAPNGIALYF